MYNSNKIFLATIFLIFLTISTALAELSVFEISKDIKKRTLTEILHRNPSIPVLVMLWGINCKPCIEESKFISTIANHFKKQIDFLAFQIEDDIDPRAVNASTANDRFNKMAQLLLPFGVKKDKIPKSFIVANEISTTWQALLSHDPTFKDSTERSSIPLFVLFDQNRKIVKIWTASILEDFVILEDFIKQIKAITGK